MAPGAHPGGQRVVESVPQVDIVCSSTVELILLFEISKAHVRLEDPLSVSSKHPAVAAPFLTLDR